MFRLGIHVLRVGLRSSLRNPGRLLAGAFALAAPILVLAIWIHVYIWAESVQGSLEWAGSQGFVVHLEPGMDAGQAELLADGVAGLAGVDKVRVITPHEGLARLRMLLGGDGDKLLDSAKADWLPPSLEVRLQGGEAVVGGVGVDGGLDVRGGGPGGERGTSAGHLDELIKQVQALAGVNSIKVAGFRSHVFSGIGVGLGKIGYLARFAFLIAVFASCVTVVGGVALMLCGRKADVAVVRVLGGTRFQAFGPAVVEGASISLLAAAIAVLAMRLGVLPIVSLPPVASLISDPPTMVGLPQGSIYEYQWLFHLLMVLACGLLGGVGALLATVRFRKWA